MLSLNIDMACACIGTINCISGKGGWRFAVVSPPTPPALDFWREFNGRNSPPQIRRHRLKAEQNFEPVLIDLLLQLIDLFVIRDGVCAEIVITLHQALECSIEAAL